MQDDTLNVREVARRAVQVLLGERAHGARANASPASASRGLVTADDLANVADGASFAVAYDTQITPLARDEAARRRIEFVHETLVRSATPRARLSIAVGADHGGFARKADILEWLRELGHQPIDLGTHDPESCDYPDFARAVAEAVASGDADLGICVDGAGIGSAMAANKVPGVLAANCWDAASAVNAREHNHANVLTLGARLERLSLHEIVRTFLATATGPGRHARRVAKIRAIEHGR